MDPSSPTEHTATPGVRRQPTWNDSLSQLDMYAEQLRVKLPLAPPGLLNGYMAVVPWIAIVFGIIFVLLSLAALVLSTVIGPLLFLLGGGGSGFGAILTSLLLLVASALGVAGGWLMLQRRLNGWWLVALGMVLELLSSLVHLSILGLIVWLLIAYVHLQVKPNYT